MTELFNITHATGDLSQYDSTAEDSGDLSAHADAALASTSYGLKCIIDDSTAIYGHVNQADPGTGKLRLRFYIDPNALTMSDGDSFVICQIGLSGSPWLLIETYLKKSGANYQIYLDFYDDAGWDSSDSVVISDAPHYVELNIVQGVSGSYQWWVDGADQDTKSSIDNQDAFGLLSYVRFGALAGIDAGTSGTLYLDELKANDDGTEIGAISSGIIVFRRRREKT